MPPRSRETRKVPSPPKPKRSPAPGDEGPPSRGDGARLVAWLALRGGEAGGAQDLLGELADRARLSERDRALAFETMQAAWRRRRLLDAALGALEGFEAADVAPPLRDLLRLGAVQHFFLDRVPPHALVHETVEVARRRLGPRRAGFVNAALQQMLRQYPKGRADLNVLAKDLPREARHSFPGWIVRLLRRVVGGERLDETLEKLNEPLPLYARVNSLLAEPERVVEDLAAAGIEARRRPGLAPFCLEVDSAAGALARSEPFRRGALFVQDASAQLASEFVDARAGMTVVDFCAAPGGKTAALAAAMEGSGRLVACDVSAARLERLDENLSRLGIAGFVGVRRLGDSDDELLAHLGDGADRVLVDAPCSGLGTLRRHPEIRWRLRGADLERLAGAQGEILDRAARLVRPGGWLVYSTCSPAPEENAQVVEAFLERRGGDFAVVEPRAEDLAEPLAKRVDSDGWLRLSPHRDVMDSASVVRLARNA